jgi:hypothetical protein
VLQDGRNWARIEADHHTHALFDVGAAGEWDSTFIGHPQVRLLVQHHAVLCCAFDTGNTIKGLPDDQQ